MNEYKSLSHMVWDGEYHIVWIPTATAEEP